MNAQKVSEEKKHTIHPGVHLEAKKIEALKNLVTEGQQKLGLSEDISIVLSYFFDKISEGKTVTIVDQTELWNVTQAAKELGVTRPTIYRMVDRGDIEGLNFDGLKIVPSSAINFIQRQELIKQKAISEINRIDSRLSQITKNLVSNKDISEDFEEIDLD